MPSLEEIRAKLRAEPAAFVESEEAIKAQLDRYIYKYVSPPSKPAKWKEKQSGEETFFAISYVLKIAETEAGKHLPILDLQYLRKQPESPESKRLVYKTIVEVPGDLETGEDLRELFLQWPSGGSRFRREILMEMMKQLKQEAMEANGASRFLALANHKITSASLICLRSVFDSASETFLGWLRDNE